MPVQRACQGENETKPFTSKGAAVCPMGTHFHTRLCRGGKSLRSMGTAATRKLLVVRNSHINSFHQRIWDLTAPLHLVSDPPPVSQSPDNGATHNPVCASQKPTPPSCHDDLSLLSDGRGSHFLSPRPLPSPSSGIISSLLGIAATCCWPPCASYNPFFTQSRDALKMQIRLWLSLLTAC